MAEIFDDIYTIGGTVQAGNGIYIPRLADKELLTLCQAGTFAYILSARQMGKSSLMVRTAESLREEGTRTAIVDLTQLGTLTSAEEWYLGFLTILEDQFLLDTDVISWWQEQKEKGIGLTQRVTLFFQEVLLTEISSRIVIFVDEIDTTLSLNFTDDFYVLIRSLHTARSRQEDLKRLSFVLIGVATPGDLIRDPARTPFNIGQRVDVTDFTLVDAAPLAAGFNLPEEQATQVLKWVLDWTGGHPYLTQRLCRAIRETGSDSWNEQVVAKVVAATFFGEKSEQDNNLQFVRDMLTKRAPDETAVLTIYQDILRSNSNVRDEEQSIIKNHLKLSGVVVPQKGFLKVRNRIYSTVFDRKWLKEHLPVNWTRQAQRFFAVAAAVFVVATLYAVGVLVVVNNQATNKINEAEQTAGVYQATQKAAQNAQATAEYAQATAYTNLYAAQTAMSKSQQNQQQIEKDDLLAQARLYAVRSQAEGVNDPELGLLLAVQAGKLVQANQLDDSSGVVKQALLNSLQNSHERLRINTPSPPLVAAYSPDGNSVAIALTNTVQIWNIPTDKLVNSLDVSNTDLTILKWSPDGQKLLDTSINTIQLWNTENYQPSATITETGTFESVEFSPDSKKLVTTILENEAELWDASSGNQLFVFKGGDDFTNSAHFNPNGTEIVTTGNKGSIHIWDSTNGQLKTTLKQGTEKTVYNALFSPDSSYILANGEDGVAIWDVATQKAINSIPISNSRNITWQPLVSRQPVAALSFLVDTNSGNFSLWQLTTGPSANVTKIADISNAFYPSWSPNGKYLAGFSSDGKELEIWNSIGNYLLNINGLTNPLYIPPIWSADSRFVLTVNKATNPAVQIWETNAANSIESLPTPPLATANQPYQQLNFSPADDFVTAHLSNSSATLRWDTATGKLLLASQALSKDGNLGLVYNSDGTTAQIIQASTGQVLSTLNGFTGTINSATFSPDNQKLATVDKNNLVQIWKAGDGSLLANFATGNAVSFTPNGELIIAKADGSSDVYDLSSGNLVTSWAGVSLAYNHAGNTVVLTGTSSPNQLSLFNLSTNQTITITATQNITVASIPKAIIFSPDDSILNLQYNSLGNNNSGAKILQLNTTTGAIINEYDGIGSISQDGKIIYYFDVNGFLNIVNAQTHQLLLSHFLATNYYIVASSISPDDKIVAFQYIVTDNNYRNTSTIGDFVFFNTADGSLKDANIPADNISNIGFSNDDEFVAIQNINPTDNSNTTEIYLNPAAVTIDDLLKLAELPNRSTRQLTQDEIQTYLIATPTPTPFVAATTASSPTISATASITSSVTVSATVSPEPTPEVATAIPYTPHVYYGTTPVYEQPTTQAVATPSPVPTATPTPTAIATTTMVAPTTPIETTTTTTVPIITTVTTSPPTTTAPTTTNAPTTATTTTNSCPILPISGFGSVYNSSSAIASKIGCATEPQRQITEAYLTFEHGFMFYEQDTDQIWVFYGQLSGSWQVYQNTWNSSMPSGHGLNPPKGLYEPMRGFGKIWYDNNLQSSLGWATQPSESSTALGAAEKFANGLMLFNPNLDVNGAKRIYVLYNSDATFVNVADSSQG